MQKLVFNRGAFPSGLMMAVLVLALILLPFVAGAVGTAWVRIINFALLYVMLALGLNIVVGFAGLLDLGYIAFYGVGAYLYALLASPHLGLHWPWWVILPIGAGLAAFFGVVLGSPTLKLRGDYLAIVTLGFGEIVRIFLNNLNTPINITNGPQGINAVDPITIGSIHFAQKSQWLGIDWSGPQKYYFLLLFLTGAIVLITQRLQHSRIGRAWEAIREDEIAARAMGLPTTQLKLLAFAMGASFGGIAGGMFAAMQGFVSPESFNLFESVIVLAMVVLGGMGHIPGVILGAVILAILPEFLRYAVEPLQRAWFGQVYMDAETLRLLVFGGALVAMMLLRPAGLYPSTLRKRELATIRSL